jgi:hypothetical protein
MDSTRHLICSPDLLERVESLLESVPSFAHKIIVDNQWSYKAVLVYENTDYAMEITDLV